jgi:hypothetical protein
MTVATWACPVCRRRVPAAVAECRCGTARPSAQALARAERGTPLPWDVKAGLAFTLLVVLAGAYVSVQPYQHPPIVPLLGWGPEKPPSPHPSPAPAVAHRRS